MLQSRLKRVEYKKKVIIYADYSNLKEAEMIQVTQRHRDLVLQENKESYFIANYVDAYGSRAYMEAAKDFTLSTKHLIKKGAFLGITGPKVFLLKGIVYFLKVNFKSFDTETEALEFLTSE